MRSCTLSSELLASGSAPPAASDTRPLCPDCFCSHRLCSVSQISPREPWEAFGFLLSSSRLTGTSFDLTVENEACSDSVWSVSALLAFLRPSGGVEAHQEGCRGRVCGRPVHATASSLRALSSPAPGSVKIRETCAARGNWGVQWAERWGWPASRGQHRGGQCQVGAAECPSPQD